MYRIAQEALTNAARHANAANVTLTLVMLPEAVRLVVEDDGRGFDPDNVPGNHYGLLGISERARLLGGTFSIQSAPGRGTRAQVEVPLSDSPGETGKP